jgi:hypothetical protein
MQTCRRDQKKLGFGDSESTRLRGRLCPSRRCTCHADVK